MPNVDEDTLIDQGAIPPTEFHDKIERIREISLFDIDVPPDLSDRLVAATSQLLIPSDTLTASAAALRAGHLILQGPPGTGKSALARALCTAFNAAVYPVTAHEDWTVFELIGRLELRLGEDRREEVVPVNGYFTEAVVRCANAVVRHFDDQVEPQAEWLLIDELNRANIDRAFGELFTVLGTDALLPITLPHQRDGNRNLVVPRRFRIIATLNSFDRQFVNNLSQAIRRRFTFISVGIPDRRPANAAWNDQNSSSLAIREFSVVLARAAERVARRLTSVEPSRTGEVTAQMLSRLHGPLGGALFSLFDLIEQIRYAGPGGSVPHLPIGTAQLIDTVEIFLLRLLQDGIGDDAAPTVLDWATAVKIVPLLDVDVIAPEVLATFAAGLTTPFDGKTRREMMGIVAAGAHFVE